MGIETATYIASLVSTNPLGSDDASEGDNHLRLIKSVLMSTFPNMDEAFYKPKVVTKTANYTLLVTDDNQVINLNSATNVTLTLPNSGTITAGWSCKVIAQQTPATTHAITRNGTPGTDTINDGASVVLGYIGEGYEIVYVGSGKFITLQHSYYNTIKWNSNNDGKDIRWLDLVYNASTPTVASTNIGLGAALLGSDYFLRTKDNAGNVRYVKRPTSQIFTASGTWTKPDGCTAIDVCCVGGGGAGGGCGATAAGESSMSGGGGGGATAVVFNNSSASSTETVTVGAGGTGVSGAGGNDGNASSLGTICVANPGAGGAASAGSASISRVSGGAGGTTGTGTIFSGDAGSPGLRLSATVPASGKGGSSHIGGGPVGQLSSAAGFAATANSGAGGGGAANQASQSARAGGAGGSGLVIVTEYYD